MSSSPSGSGSAGPSIVRVGFYEIERTIGKGNFAVVKLARHRITKTQVAIKIIDKKRLDEENLEKIYREVQILKLLEHQNIIKLYQVMETSNMVYIVSEFAENGEVFEYIAKKGRLSEDEAHAKFVQILDAVDYCHQNHVVHRDLKAENLLLDSEMNIKIADFGFGNFFTSNHDLSTWCGSPPYAAPEVFEGQKYVGPRIDVWSLGVILYVLVCGSLPFDGHDFQTLRDRVLSGRFRIPYFMSTDCENLIKKILILDPKRRYTIAQIRRHRWVTSRVVMFPLPSPIRTPQRRCHQDLDECALRLMQNLGMDLQKITEAIKTDAFNHYTAIYYLLLEKLLKHRTAYLNMAQTGQISPTRNVPMVASGSTKEVPPRRPSSIADQAMMPRPVLAETKQGPFSHTTDCAQVPLINLIDEKGTKESQLTEVSSDLNSQEKISVDEGVDMDCGSTCSRDNSQDLPFIPSGRRRHGSYRDALRDLSQNSSASFQSIGTGISESPQVSFDLEAETTSSYLQYDASAAHVYPDPSSSQSAAGTSQVSEPCRRILQPNILPRLPFTRTSMALGNLTSPTVTMTPPFSAKFYHPSNGSSGLSVSGLVESGGNGGSGCQVGGPDVRDARSPVNFREGRRASDEFLASAVKNNAVPFRQRLRETSKAWAVVTEHSCSTDKPTCIGSGDDDKASRSKDHEMTDQAMVDFPSEERAQVLHRRNIFQTHLNNYLFKPSLLVPATMVAVIPTGIEVIPPAVQFRFQHLQIDHGKPLDPRIIPHHVNIDYSMPQRAAMVPTQLESFDASISSRVKRRRFVRQASYRLSQGSEGELSSTSWLPSSEPLSPTFEVMEDEEEEEDEEKEKEGVTEERDVCDMEC